MTGKVFLGRLLFGLAFGAAAMWLVRVSAVAFGRRRRWKEEGVVVEGEIVGFEERADTNPSDRRKLFAPIVEFRTDAGAPLRFTSSVANRPNPYQVGQKIAVRYMRITPSEADLESVTGSVLLPLAAAVMALAFFGVVLLTIFLPAPSR